MKDTRTNSVDFLRRVTYLTTSVGGNTKRDWDT